ncbi:DNA-binding CsgD family transcriptional regulator [Pedobacter sp. AK017]|uniref:LuxR C-terminal-related transcriptional regulator n=1 Tax=Pedobacter sp. AK017 TaxID=2723073 RepID=UPI0016117E32|nr:LuxR C-terminal-related transcriptional regulator [Pedobacter sp. AK017]MBB5437950.1 DNA-binding CsgD family transcriptional regulator [Pedobacter sp. AK017]
MKAEIQTLHNVWAAHRSINVTDGHQISFNELTNSIVSTGPISFFIIDFYDMSISHVSDSVYEIHGLNPGSITINDILCLLHPDDIKFVIKAEEFLTTFFINKVGRDKLMSYKISYNYRVRLKNGNYVLFNHQALMLTLDKTGGYGKSLIINTRIDHLGHTPNYKISLIGLHGEPSFMNLSIDENTEVPISFSKREIDIIKNISKGLNSGEIADKLFIAESTVKQHRKNILTKAECKNTAQLVKTCILHGLI